jgi:MFS family permease
MSGENYMHTTKRRKLPANVWLLCFVSFFADISSEMMYPLLPLFVIGVLGANEIQLGAMEGAAVLLVSLMSAYAGIRSDRSASTAGRTRWLHWGYGLPVLGKTLIAFASSWWWIFTGRMLDRFGKGLRGAPRDALIVDSVPSDQRGEAFGLHRALDTAGALVGVLIAAFLLWYLTGAPDQSQVTTPPKLSLQSFQQIFLVSAILGLTSWGLTFLVREPRGKLDSDTKEISLNQSDSAESPKSATSFQRIQALPKSYWSVILMLIIFALANSSDTFLLLKVSELGFTPWAVVLAYAIYNIVYAALSYPIGLLSDRIGRWKLIAAGWLIYALVYAGFALLTPANHQAVWVLLAIYGIYIALTDGVGKALVADVAPKSHRGTAMGIYYALTGIASLASSILTGWIWHSAGAASALFTSAAFAVVALILLATHRRNWRSIT